ncbi:MAG: PH domain-containing protein [Planctomycetota bacterium]|nr:MAG: PH domain-containing protein [Planctomycetota bacterium]
MLSAVAAEAPPAPAALAAIPREVIDGGEIVLLAVKPSLWRPFFQALPWLVCCGGAALAVTALHAELPGLSPTTTAQLALLVGLIRLGLAVIHWVPDWYVLTNRRILTISGVRRLHVSACELRELSDALLQRSLFERLTRTGTLQFVPLGEAQPAPRWESLPHPQEVHEKVIRILNRSRFRDSFA